MKVALITRLFASIGLVIVIAGRMENIFALPQGIIFAVFFAVFFVAVLIALFRD